MADETADPLCLLQVDYYYIEFAAQPSITCYHQLLTLTWQDSEEGEQTLQMEKPVTMRLLRKSEKPDAVKDAKAEPRILFNVKEPGIVRATGLRAGQVVKAYAADGRTVATATANAAGEAVINVKTQTRGMYVISAGKRETFKILKP